MSEYNVFTKIGQLTVENDVLRQRIAELEAEIEALKAKAAAETTLERK